MGGEGVGVGEAVGGGWGVGFYAFGGCGCQFGRWRGGMGGRGEGRAYVCGWDRGLICRGSGLGALGVGAMVLVVVLGLW